VGWSQDNATTPSHWLIFIPSTAAVEPVAIGGHWCQDSRENRHIFGGILTLLYWRGGGGVVAGRADDVVSSAGLRPQHHLHCRAGSAWWVLGLGLGLARRPSAAGGGVQAWVWAPMLVPCLRRPRFVPRRRCWWLDGTGRPATMLAPLRGHCHRRGGPRRRAGRAGGAWQRGASAQPTDARGLALVGSWTCRGGWEGCGEWVEHTGSQREHEGKPERAQEKRVQQTHREAAQIQGAEPRTRAWGWGMVEGRLNRPNRVRIRRARKNASTHSRKGGRAGQASKQAEKKAKNT
jgi:hypothetical protein